MPAVAAAMLFCVAVVTVVRVQSDNGSGRPSGIDGGSLENAVSDDAGAQEGADDAHPAGGGDVEGSRGPPEPDRDPLADRWDAMSGSERTEIQRRRFVGAVADARSGVDVQRNLAEARDALTLLRAELYATEHGRAEHRELEQEYDLVADGVASNPADPADPADPDDPADPEEPR